MADVLCCIWQFQQQWKYFRRSSDSEEFGVSNISAKEWKCQWHIASDAHAEKRIGGVGTRITFYQEGSHVEYIYWLHSLISTRGYCSEAIPIVTKRLVKGGKIRNIVRFRTWTYTSFNWIHDIWYTDGKKKIPSCIDTYLTPLALAILIMDDGSKVSQGLKLCTNSYTYS